MRSLGWSRCNSRIDFSLHFIALAACWSCCSHWSAAQGLDDGFYVYVYGAPLGASNVPVVCGFRTASVGAWGTQAKIEITATSGLDFSSFDFQDLRDAFGPLQLSHFERFETQVRLVFSTPLQPDTAYELTLVAATSGSIGATLGSITVRWYGYGQTDGWIVLGERIGNTAGSGGEGDLANATLSTAAASLLGSGIKAAWASSDASMLAVVVELKSDHLLDGVVSLMPFPPSLWNFGENLEDGATCPVGAMGDEYNAVVGVRLPSMASNCFVRKRGRLLNSFDLWFSVANVSDGVTLTLMMPRIEAEPAAAWFAVYKERGSTPRGYSVQQLMLGDAARRVLGPQPAATLLNATTMAPGRRSSLRIAVRPGASLIYSAGARVELRFDSTAFIVEYDGCAFGTSSSAMFVRPLDATASTDVDMNTCIFTMGANGIAFWSHAFEAFVTGVNAVPSSQNVTIVVGSFQVWVTTDGTNDDLKTASAPFLGLGYTVESPPQLWAAGLHPTTVAASAKARVLLAFETGTSTHLSGGSEEDDTEGMVIRLTILDTSLLSLYKADGSAFVDNPPESLGLECSVWLLEVWSSSVGGFPAPSTCWWDSFTNPVPTISMRFPQRGGLRSRSRYELVFHAALSDAANDRDVISIEILKGVYIIQEGVVQTSKTIVPQARAGYLDEPLITSLEVIGADPLPQIPVADESDGKLQIRVRGGDDVKNRIGEGNIVRLFLFPLTRWAAISCSATRSDGSLPVCAVETTGRLGNTLALTMDGNAPQLNSTTDVIITILGVGNGPDGGNFRGELGAEVWYNPRESTKFSASFTTSTDRPLSLNNFVSAQVTAGFGGVVGSDTPFARSVGNNVALYYAPATSCFSTNEVPCRIVVQVPQGFMVREAYSGESVSSFMQTFIAAEAYADLSLASAPRCDSAARTCTLELVPGAMLWAGTRYAFSIHVSNPPYPISADSAQNVWTVHFSGAGRYGFGFREEAAIAYLTNSRAIDILGRLQLPVASPSSLTCGAGSDVDSPEYLYLHFQTTQEVLTGGKVVVEAPDGFSFNLPGTDADAMGLCRVVGRVGDWSQANCTALGPTATVVLTEPLEADNFYAFDLQVRLPPTTTVAPNQLYFGISTESENGTRLDVAQRVTWSAQTEPQSGKLVFENSFDCYPQGLQRFEILVDDMRPYRSVWKPANVTILFSLGIVDISDYPLDVRVYAPAGFRWRVEANGTNLDVSSPPTAALAGGGHAAPLVPFPGASYDSDRKDVNMLRLMSTEYLKHDVLYGFTALAEVPSATPGTSANAASGESWHILFGTGAIGQQRWAAAAASQNQPRVRAIFDFEVRLAFAARGWSSLRTGRLLSVAFTTVTNLPAGGILQLLLPPDFDFATHLGKACGAFDSELAGTSLPADASLSCVTLPGSSTLAFQWMMGATGLLPGRLVPGGRYGVGVYIRNKEIIANSYDHASGHFAIRTFLSAASASLGTPAVAADIEAIAEEDGIDTDGTTVLRYVELALAYMDASAAIFDARPGAFSWVAFAFELVKDLPPNFDILVRGPFGFRFDRDCDVHIGDGTSLSALGDVATTLSPRITRYIPFPPNMTASCEGDFQDARISIAPKVRGTVNVFKASPRQLFVFRVQVKNGQTAPALNEWSLSVDRHTFGGIRGYELWEFRTPVAIVPTSTAAGDMNKIIVRFRNAHELPGLTRSDDHGLLLVVMPAGFNLVRENSSLTVGPCLGFDGIMNTTFGERTPVTAVGMKCEGFKDAPNGIFVRNKMAIALAPSEYEFSVVVQNPLQPIEATEWRLVSYDIKWLDRSEIAAQQRLREDTPIDVLFVPGFAVNLQLHPFYLAPHPSGMQSSGSSIMMKFGVYLARDIQIGDALIANSPIEYSFEASSQQHECIKYVGSLPRPQCAGNRIVFSFAGVSGTWLPRIAPLGSSSATAISFELQVTNPPTKPLENVLELVHCRGVSYDLSAGLARAATSPSDDHDRCILGGSPVGSVRRELWPIIPRLKDVTFHTSDSLAPPEFGVQGRISPFVLSFVAVSAGATKVRVESEGFDFSQCEAEYQSAAVSCAGGLGSADITLTTATGVAKQIPVDGSSFQIKVSQVVNPTSSGPTQWNVITYYDGGGNNDVIADSAESKVGYPILRYLGMEATVECQVEVLLDPQTPEAVKDTCTASAPWYQQSGSPVRLRFRGMTGGEIMRGHRMLIQPPKTYSFTRPHVTTALVGFPGQITTLTNTLEMASALQRKGVVSFTPVADHLGDEALLIDFDMGVALTQPFALQVLVDLPAVQPAINRWRVVIVDQRGHALYSNDDSWQGFLLYGTFVAATSLTSRVSDFPSERNVIRLRISLASPLTGTALKLWVVAPGGFVFDVGCLPTDPEILPRPVVVSTAGFVSNSAWVTGCVAETSSRNIAKLSVQALRRLFFYETDLQLTNAADTAPGATWQLFTFANNELDFLHYTKLSSFPLRVLEATVVPEVKRFGESSMMHISMTPQRDLGPLGQVVINAPTGFLLFCSLEPYFDAGNLPNGVECSGANRFAKIQLSGSDSLERGATYRFAVRVTNPTKAEYSGLSLQGAAPWGIRLQTFDQGLVHESERVVGYVPSDRAVLHFKITPNIVAAGDVAVLEVQFKLETILLRWRENIVELRAPQGFNFACAAELARDAFVTPSASAVLPASVVSFTDFASVLERPPPKGTEAYRNDGTTTDGRAIADCSRPGILALAVDYTDVMDQGRYAFRTTVQNAVQVPTPNVWRLMSYAGGDLAEEGAAGGYSLGSTAGASTSPSPAPGMVSVDGVASGVMLRRVAVWWVAVAALII